MPQINTGPEASAGREPVPVPSERLLKKRLRNSRIVAAILMIPGLPIIGAMIVAVRLTSRGAAIYTQERVGLNGETFRIFKIRSMRLDAEKGSGAVWAQAKDPRVTWIGRILRFTHLDELPQLFNILKGEMCLNGPRPERPEFVNELVNKVPRYKERLLVHPGVTGLAQVRAPADSDLQTVRNKLTLDLAYIRELEREPMLDLRIIFATLLKMTAVPRTIAAASVGLQKIVRVDLDATPQESKERRAA